MEPIRTVAGHEAIDRDELLVHDWRVTQLTRLGIPGHLAEGAASHVDWHEIAGLVQRGCPRCSPSASSADAVMNRALPRPGGSAGAAVTAVRASRSAGSRDAPVGPTGGRR